MSHGEKIKTFSQNSEMDEDMCRDILEQTEWDLISAFEQFGLSVPSDASRTLMETPTRMTPTRGHLSRALSMESEREWKVCSPKLKKKLPKESVFAVPKRENSCLIKKYPPKVSKEEIEASLRKELCYPATKDLILALGGSEYPPTVVLLRGLPGSGKSTLGALLASLSYTGVKIGADDYFMQNGVYKFNRNMLKEAHTYSQDRCNAEMLRKASPIVIDNTNTEAWEMLPYVTLAHRFGYKIEIVEPNTKWKFDSRMLSKKNTHGVPKEHIERMKSRYDHTITEKSLLQAIGVSEVTKKEPQQRCRSAEPGVSSSARQLCVSDFIYVKKHKSPKRAAKEDVPLCLNENIELTPVDSYPSNICKYDPAVYSILENISPPRMAAIFPCAVNGNQDEKLEEDWVQNQHLDTNQKLFEGNQNETDDIECTEETRNSLKTMFPNQKLEFLEEYWKSCGGDINYCCDLLLESGYGAETEVPTKVELFENSTAMEADHLQSNIENIELLGAVGGRLRNKSIYASGSSDSVDEDNNKRKSGSLDEFYVPIDGDDWLNLQLPTSFVSKLTENYSSQIYGTDLSNLPEEFLRIKVPPKLAFKLFQLLSLNVLKRVEASNFAQELEQIESDAKFAAFLAENEISEVSFQEPTLVQISNLEVKLREGQMSRARETRDQIPIKFASLLKLHKLKSCFPRVPDYIVKQNFEDCGETFDLALDKLKMMFPGQFDPSGLSEVLECKEEIKFAINKQLETLQEMRCGSSPEPDEKTGFEWRELSLKHYQLRQEYQEKVQIASRENHHYEVARHYAVMSATHNEQMNNAKAKAKEWFLMHFNQHGSSNKLDLHGQTTKDAIALLSQFIKEKIGGFKMNKFKKGENVLQIITGRGNNSIDGVARLHPAVKEFLIRRGLRYEESSGQFFVKINHQTKH